MRNYAVLEYVLYGLCASILVVGKIVLALPNIEIVSLLIIIYTLTFGIKRTLAITIIFIIVDSILFFNIVAVIQYIIVWPLLVILTNLFKKHLKLDFLLWAVYSGIYGFLFGFICAIPHILYFNLSKGAIISYLIADIFWNAVHMVGNYIIMLLGGNIIFSTIIKISYNLNLKVVKDKYEIKDNKVIPKT